MSDFTDTDEYGNKVFDDQGNPMIKLGNTYFREDDLTSAMQRLEEEQKARANEPENIDEFLRVEQFIPTVDYSQSTGELVNIRKVRTLAEAPDSGFPTGLFPSSGPLSDMMDYLLAYTGHCNPVLALGGAISTFAALLGGLIESPTHLRTNLYTMLIAPSGTGKTQTFKAIYKLLNPLDPYLVRTTRFASSVAIERSFYREPDDDSDVPADRAPFCRTLYCIDEFHRYLDAANNPRAPQYLRGIADTFKEVYTNTTIGNSSSTSDKANRFRYRWHNMHILAASNPYEFWKSCSGTDQITHWYNTHYPNRSTTGHVTSITTYGPNNGHLRIQYAENHDGGHPMYDIISECDILYYSFCTPDQIYTAWQDSH